MSLFLLKVMELYLKKESTSIWERLQQSIRADRKGQMEFSSQNACSQKLFIKSFLNWIELNLFSRPNYVFRSKEHVYVQ